MSKLETADTPPQSAAHQPESTQSFFRDAYALQSDRSSVGQTGGENKVASTAPDAGIDTNKNASLGLPNLELTGDLSGAKSGTMPGKDSGRSFMDSAKDTLTNPNASMNDKLKTVSELGQKGVDKIQLPDADGKMRDYAVQVQDAGARKMVNLFGKDEDGRSRVVLRGIQETNGSFTQQKDRNGNSVGFTGQQRSFFERSTVDNTGTGSAPVDQKAARPEPRKIESAPEQRPPQATKVERRDDRAEPSAPPAPKVERRDDRAEPTVKPGTDGKTPVKSDAKASEAPKPVDRSELPPGRMDRSQFDKELQDPKVMAAFAGRMHKEVRGQGPASQLAFAEEVMNRAAARNQTLMQALSGSYYPTSKPGHSDNPRYHEAITKAWKEGTDTIHGATGNASGRVGFGVPGGRHDASGRWVSPNQTVNIGGERFGYEQQDLKRGWLAKYQQLKGLGTGTAIADR